MMKDYSCDLCGAKIPSSETVKGALNSTKAMAIEGKKWTFRLEVHIHNHNNTFHKDGDTCNKCKWELIKKAAAKAP